MLTIDIYFKNRDEPKKVTFSYDLDLAPIKSQKEEYVFTNPTDEFRRKCLKGGGVIVTNLSSDQKIRDSFSSKTTSSAINLSNDSKKHKRPDDAKNISGLFGSSKKPSSKVSPDPRAINSSPNPIKVGGKGSGGEKPSISSSKDKDKGKHKHSGNKDSKESKKEERSASKSEESKSKKDKKERRERDKDKEKKHHDVELD